MKNVFLESGKSLLILGNLGFVLLFLKQYLQTNSFNDLTTAILFLIIAYFVGNLLIYLSGFFKKDNHE
jgi:hypothetical protein